MFRKFIPFMFLVSVVFAVNGLAQPGHGHQGKSCSLTARDALKACRRKAESDHYIARGNCNNITDVLKVRECFMHAVKTRKVEYKQCSTQYDARQEICSDIGQAAYAPNIDPRLFVNPSEIGNGVTANKYFMLIPGRTMIYKGGDETIKVTVTRNTRVIQGVTCVEVRDVVTENGVLIEDTKDWYAQDLKGNVWYFGEISKNYEEGRLVNLDGSWLAGVDGAKPGIVMFANPVIGKTYRQEFLLGEAEDMAKIMSLTGSGTTPGESCDGTCLVTKEYNPFEPAGIEHKYYKAGVGFVLEIKPGSGERLELVEIRNE